MLRTGQVTVSGGSASSLCTVPPGPCVVVLSSDPASAATAYVGVTPGTGGTLSSSNGIPLASGASLTFPGYGAATGASLSVVAAGTASATIGWLVSRS
jgi:hypothetical protein